MINKIILRANYVVRLSAISLLFLINPVIAMFINILFDTIDGTIYEYILRIDKSKYQTDDKILDFAYYIGLLVFVVHTQMPGQILLISLFAYRSIGQLIFFFSKKREVFVYFPNFFEYFVLGFLILGEIKKRQLFPQYDLTLPLFSAIVLFKIWQECFLHWQKKTAFKVFWLPLIRLIKPLARQKV